MFQTRWRGIFKLNSESNADGKTPDCRIKTLAIFDMQKTLILLVNLIIGNLFVDTLYAQCRTINWSDDFEIDGVPDKRKWKSEVGDGCPDLCGWGNNELQFYTDMNPENVRVENGFLILEAHRKVEEDSIYYTSAKLITRELREWTYGTLEVRAKLPGGVGVWPAIWMLPADRSDGWPLCGEIDVMEHVGFDPTMIYGTVHTEKYNHLIGTQKAGEIEVEDCEEDFHDYRIKWSPERIEFYVDKLRYYTYAKREDNKEAWPFDKDFYLILNIAVGGNWGGEEGVAEDIWPQKMIVDHVRVYR